MHWHLAPIAWLQLQCGGQCTQLSLNPDNTIVGIAHPTIIENGARFVVDSYQPSVISQNLITSSSYFYFLEFNKTVTLWLIASWNDYLKFIFEYKQAYKRLLIA